MLKLIYTSLNYCFFFFKDTATTNIYTLSLHDALPIWNNSLKTKLSLLPKKLFRIRMSRNFGMKMRLILIRSEERFSRNAETDLVCRLLLEKKKKYIPGNPMLHQGRHLQDVAASL